MRAATTQINVTDWFMQLITVTLNTKMGILVCVNTQHISVLTVLSELPKGNNDRLIS